MSGARVATKMPTRAVEILSDWQVACMPSLAGFPPDQAEARGSFGEYAREWAGGSSFLRRPCGCRFSDRC
ncbi:hypothetical protein ACMDCR_29290 [Labrys okinawensis]|uniref:hypothetical protein n=1 Tax=Labrys okinawensis TaxID=346911 RepID=UPI0039BC6049